jgi:hypothetical protein
MKRKEKKKIQEKRKIIIKNNKIQEAKVKNKIKKKKTRIELSDSFNEVLQKLRNNPIQSKKQTKKNIY